jgi:hypothetical protein
MADRRQLEFFLLRYVPDAVKGEFVNFGVMTLENGPNGNALIDVRFTRNWERVQCLDPQADLEVLLALEREIRQETGRANDQLSWLKKMEDSFSGLVQVSPVMPALTEKLAFAEIEDVARMFLETSKQRRIREPAGRQKILETMKNEFEKAGILALLTEVAVEPYTNPGDPFEFDFGYRFGTEIKLFQAVSMKASVDSGVLLAARYPRIMPVMSKMTEAAPVLTAVIDDDLDRGKESVQFALKMMEEEKILVRVAAEMPAIADSARRELRA